RVVYPPTRNVEGKIKLGWLTVGSLSELKERKPILIEYGEDRVFLVKINENVLALNASCPHLGCLLVWSNDENRFKCPCHAGFFEIDGKLIGGPPPRDMDRFEVKIEKTEIMVKGS
ncbi:MAG: Rieske (2Fe-2S) protein, partial [Actinomycetia bacterium]|nr:Rieske (2Fe-2S) protein [Actinomycetes bacterium]